MSARGDIRADCGRAMAGIHMDAPAYKKTPGTDVPGVLSR